LPLAHFLPIALAGAEKMLYAALYSASRARMRLFINCKYI